ncbi:MAG: HEAT repeat domain-containing protein [Deltaproteobacteria bacterium]|nr:HEAT repeat domain-containing protein [Deltaproteobacteria bacterium]
MGTDHTTILIELNRAVKALNFYPKWHPRLEAALGGFYSVLKEATSEKGEIKWKIDNKGIYDGKTPIAPNLPATSSLARQLFLRKVKAVKFLPAVSPADTRALIEILIMEPKDIFDKGGVDKVMAGKGTGSILLNEMSYEQLEELRKESEEERRVAAKRMEHTQESGEMEEGARLKQGGKPEKEPREEESLESLLKRIDKETDFLIYNDVSIRITEKADVLIGKNRFDEAMPAFVLFLKHSMPKYSPTEEIKKKAGECLVRFLCSEELLAYLVKRIAGTEEPDRMKFQAMVWKAGDAVIDLLIDALIETPQANARRHLFNTLVKFGEKIRPRVESRLNDARWYVVRQMVTILGELGGEESTEPLERAYSHNDMRVKKEVLKSLGRIPSVKSSQVLLSAVRDGDKSLQGQAIISLGMLKDAAAINALGELALKREPFTDNFQMKKEAIKALGIIGDKRAVSFLTKLLLKKVWFRKDEHEELRMLAVVSLGKIGGKEAVSAIEKIYKDSTGILYNTCKRALEGSGGEGE